MLTSSVCSVLCRPEGDKLLDYLEKGVMDAVEKGHLRSMVISVYLVSSLSTRSTSAVRSLILSLVRFQNLDDPQKSVLSLLLASFISAADSIQLSSSLALSSVIEVRPFT